MPLSKIKSKNIEKFCTTLKARLKDKTQKFGKDYLRLLVDEIKIKGKEIYLKGSYSALTGSLLNKKVDTLHRVPTFFSPWLPGTDSNCRQGG